MYLFYNLYRSCVLFVYVCLLTWFLVICVIIFQQQHLFDFVMAKEICEIDPASLQYLVFNFLIITNISENVPRDQVVLKSSFSNFFHLLFQAL